MSNTFGNIFRLTTFGESHGPGVGGVVDGFPAGIDIDLDFIQHELDRRRPGQSRITTPRKEADKVELLSGVFEGKSTGCPIGFLVRNTNQHSNDYDNIRNLYRPSHADFTYTQKYGLRDHTGGGRSSARETIARCVGGALAKLALKQIGVEIYAYTSQVGNIALEHDYTHYDPTQIETNDVRCPDAEKSRFHGKPHFGSQSKGRYYRRYHHGVIRHCPIGLGEPVYGKLHAALGGAMLGINAVKGFEYGRGFAGVSQRGSEQNDVFIPQNGAIGTRTNHSGGIQGGISNGQDIYFRGSFQAGRYHPDGTGNRNTGRNPDYHKSPRTARCLCTPRAVPVVEAMAAMTILDYYLLNKTTHL